MDFQTGWRSGHGNMNHAPRHLFLFVTLAFVSFSFAGFVHGEEVSDAKPLAVVIGKQIFLDSTLSQPVGQGCFSCHRAETAFADSRPISPGAVKGRVGRRNSPSLMYAALIPGFAYEDVQTDDGTEVYAWEGGLFHDGRAGDLFEQVQQPFFDPNEMNLPDEETLASRLRDSEYAAEFRQWVGDEIWKDDQRLNYHAFRALVEFLKEPIFRPFDARIDDYLNGKAALTQAELRGLEIFRGAGKCADCHLLQPSSWAGPLLSDYGYDNLGVPSRGKKDAGLGGQTGEAAELGQFRAPSLRNIVLTAPYMHNGSIKTLKEVLEFYNRRDVEPERWGHTDYPVTVNREDMGDLKLTEQQVSDLLALMNAFTDRTLLNRKDTDDFPATTNETPSTDELRLYFPDWTHRKHPAYPGKCDPPSSLSRNAAES
jgi:cytochrome c peroxidase